MRVATVDLVAVAEHGIQVVRRHPDCPADADLSMIAPERPVSVEGDQDLLHRVVSNLVLNAVQAAAGVPRVSVEVRVPESGDLPPTVVLESPRLLVVRDQGPGIPAEILRAPVRAVRHRARRRHRAGVAHRATRRAGAPRTHLLRHREGPRHGLLGLPALAPQRGGGRRERPPEDPRRRRRVRHPRLPRHPVQERGVRGGDGPGGQGGARRAGAVPPGRAAVRHPDAGRVGDRRAGGRAQAGPGAPRHPDDRPGGAADGHRRRQPGRVPVRPEAVRDGGPGGDLPAGAGESAAQGREPEPAPGDPPPGPVAERAPHRAARSRSSRC